MSDNKRANGYSFVGVEGSRRSNLRVQLIRAIIRVRVSMDSLSELPEDLSNLGCLLQVLKIGSLEDFDVRGLDNLGPERHGHVEVLDDLVGLSFLSLWLLDLLASLLHLLIFCLIPVEYWWLAGFIGLLFPKVHIRCEDGDVLWIV